MRVVGQITEPAAVAVALVALVATPLIKLAVREVAPFIQTFSAVGLLHTLALAVAERAIKIKALAAAMVEALEAVLQGARQRVMGQVVAALVIMVEALAIKGNGLADMRFKL